jgi:hypothetical protein
LVILEFPMPLLRARSKDPLIYCLLFISLLSSRLLSAQQPSVSSSPQYSVFSRDGSQLIFVNAAGNEIIKQHARTGKIIKRIPFKLAAGSRLLAPTPDGFKLLAVHSRGIDVIHNGMGTVLRTLPHPSGRYDWQGRPIQQNLDGTLLAIPSLRNAQPKIYLIHTGTGKIIRTIKLSALGGKWHPSNSIGSFGFSASQSLLAYTLYTQGKSTLYLYDINKQNIKMQIDMGRVTKGRHETLHFDRQNKQLLISASTQPHIKLVDFQQKTIKKLHYPQTSYANFSIDNKNLLIIQPYKNLVILRNLTTGRQQQYKLSAKKTDYLPIIIQSSKKALLALPLRPSAAKAPQQFLLINGRSGRAMD